MLRYIIRSFIYIWVKSLFNQRKSIREYWNGPKSSENERSDNLRWIEDFISRHDYKGFEDYPDLHKRVAVHKAYEHITKMYHDGFISTEDYNVFVERLAKQIDISEDIKIS